MKISLADSFEIHLNSVEDLLRREYLVVYTEEIPES